MNLLRVVVLLLCAWPGLAQSSDLPDSRKTPGDVLAVTKADICTPGYSKKVRDVSEAVKRQVYASYHITTRAPREYEVDHLISLELGGSNSLRNLWPQSYLTTPWNAHVKDKLENHLHSLVCKGQLELAVAQREIATDWIAAYKKYFGAPTGKAPVPTGPPQAGPIVGNKASKIYHLPSCAGYNRVGEKNRVLFQTAAEAEAAGYRKAANCP